MYIAGKHKMSSIFQTFSNTFSLMKIITCWFQFHSILLHCFPFKEEGGISHYHQDQCIILMAYYKTDIVTVNVLQIPQSCTSISSRIRQSLPDSKGHGAKMGPTWVLSAPDGPHVGLMNLAIRVCKCAIPYWRWRKKIKINITSKVWKHLPAPWFDTWPFAAQLAGAPGLGYSGYRSDTGARPLFSTPWHPIADLQPTTTPPDGARLITAIAN